MRIRAPIDISFSISFTVDTASSSSPGSPPMTSTTGLKPMETAVLTASSTAATSWTLFMAFNSLSEAVWRPKERRRFAA
jgi:hypothetical protein